MPLNRVKSSEADKHEREDRLLIACASTVVASADLSPVTNVLPENFDWKYFYHLARRHSLVPLVYRQIETSFKSTVPADVLQRFKKDYQENAARNLIFLDELSVLLDRFANASVEVIVFKGPALAVSAYGDLNLRRFVDLDLIARREDMARAIEVLTHSGYVSSRELTGEQQAVLLRTQHNLQFTRGRVIVELHWQVASELFASTVTAEELWGNLTTIELAKRKVKTLATDDLLFALCVHGSRHLWQRLAWICDIDRIISTGGTINWPALCERAGRANAQRMFLLGPALAARLLGTDLPQTVARAIARDNRLGSLCDEIIERLFDGPEQSALPVATVIRFNLLIRKGWRSRFNYGRYVFAPTDSDLDAVRLKPPFHFLYYLLRPFRLLHSTLRQH